MISTRRVIATKVASLSLVFTAGLLAVGCGSSSGSNAGTPDDAAGENVNTTATPATALNELALAVALSQIDPANYPAPASPPAVTVTGGSTPASGSATIDFGGGTVVNNGSVAGVLNVSWTSTGAPPTSATITLSPSNLLVTGRGQTATVSGTQTISATLTGATASGGITGRLTIVSSSYGTSTADSNLTYTLNATTGVITLGGRVDVDNTLYGDWTARFNAVTAQVTAASRTVSSGTITLERNTFPSVDMDLQFTGPNTGTLTLTGGLTRSFTL